MMTCRGKVQRSDGVIHLIAEHLLDETELLNSVGSQNQTSSLPAGRGDEDRYTNCESAEFSLNMVRLALMCQHALFHIVSIS
jgi:hypothetical protein